MMTTMAMAMMTNDVDDCDDAHDSDDVDDVCAFIYFTDAYGDVSEDVEPSVPVIWAITHNGYEYDPNFPFGENVYVNVSEFH